MTNSLANRLAALVLPALMAASPALAQPMPLTPRAPDQTVGESHPPQIQVVPSPMLDPAAPPPANGSGRFVMEELKAPDIDSVGVLDDRQGGLGAGLWHGSSASLVRRFLPQLPVASVSRTTRSLARRLLLSAAAPPEGNAGLMPPLLELRAERLYAMGEIEGLANLLKSSPASVSSPLLARIKIDTYLLAGDAPAACREAALSGGGEPRLAVFCQLINGKALEANMALDMMRERKDADQAFIAAAEAMAGTPPAKVERLPHPTPLHLAAFKAAKIPLPADTTASAPPAMLRVLAETPSLPADIRLAAAERAESLGIIDTDTLRRLYGATTLGPAEQPVAQAQGDRHPLGRVLLLRLTQAEQTPTVRAALLGRVLTGAAERGALASVARLYAPVIADLKPVPELAPFAPLLARALYAAGRPEAAGTWVVLAKADPSTAKGADDLWALGRLYRSSGADAGTAVYESWRGARQLPPDQAERRGVVALDLLQALGERIPQAEWLALAPLTAATDAGPRPAVKALLRSAAEGARLGETLLLSLVALGDGGLDKVDPDTLNRVIAFLRVVGLEKEARELAVEAALANGV
jgi:hypothetical protein